MNSVISQASPTVPPRTTTTDNSNRYRLAIVGCGPRGLQCLESLSRNLSEEQLRRLEITIYETTDCPGAGRIYDPSQPHTLRMNFATQHIDFWKTASSQTTNRSGSLIGWLSKNHPELAKSDNYVPRAIVGEYLQACFASVRDRLTKFTPIDVKRSTVRDVRREGHRFQIQADDATNSYFDHVVLTTGHEGLRQSNGLQAESNEVFVFPVETNLSTAKIPPRAKVRVRGFGLTAIDAILMLTEGRGGSFGGSRMGLPVYHASRNEPLRIDVRCRSGRPMLAKPTALVEPISDTFWIPFRQQLAALERNRGRLSFQRDLWSVVTTAASELLRQSGSHVDPRQVQDWYRSWSRYKMDGCDTYRAMLQSYAVAVGKRPRDIPYAIGESWRKLYPEIVQRVGFGGLRPQDWGCFQTVSTELERLAFGPPAESVAKLLRLIREGILTVGSRHSRNEPLDYDITVNAVIASTHQTEASGPLANLIAEGLVTRDSISGAIKVDQDGNAIGSSGGLSIFGRCTEGWVIGNDTLSRTLHPQIENWSKTFARKIYV